MAESSSLHRCATSFAPKWNCERESAHTLLCWRTCAKLPFTSTHSARTLPQLPSFDGTTDFGYPRGLGLRASCADTFSLLVYCYAYLLLLICTGFTHLIYVAYAFLYFLNVRYYILSAFCIYFVPRLGHRSSSCISFGR